MPSSTTGAASTGSPAPIQPEEDSWAEWSQSILPARSGSSKQTGWFSAGDDQDKNGGQVELADSSKVEAVDADGYNQQNSTSVLALSKEFDGQYYLVKDEAGEYLCASSSTPGYIAVYAYAGYQGYAYSSLQDLSDSAAWRDATVEYRFDGDNYQVRFVWSDVYYVVQWESETAGENVADVLSFIFA